MGKGCETGYAIKVCKFEWEEGELKFRAFPSGGMGGGIPPLTKIFPSPPPPTCFPPTNMLFPPHKFPFPTPLK